MVLKIRATKQKEAYNLLKSSNATDIELIILALSHILQRIAKPDDVYANAMMQVLIEHATCDDIKEHQ